MLSRPTEGYHISRGGSAVKKKEFSHVPYRGMSTSLRVGETNLSLPVLNRGYVAVYFGLSEV